MENPFKKRIALYTSFIKAGKVRGCEEIYLKGIEKAQEILKRLKSKTITAEYFNSLKHQDKWDLFPLLKKVEWICSNCKEVDDTKPYRVWDGSLHCGNCNFELTQRTGGGQGDEFNWTIKEEKIKDMEITTTIARAFSKECNGCKKTDTEVMLTFKKDEEFIDIFLTQEQAKGLQEELAKVISFNEEK